MNENLDLTELLKDCPKGTKFYSSYLGRDVFFIGIHNNYIECEYPSKIDSPFNSTIQFRKEGSFFKEGECMLFPSKDQRDWSKWHRFFKDGDVITCTNSVCSFVAIFKETNTDMSFKRYVSLTLDDEQQFCTKEGWADFKNPRFATKEEEQKLFNAIKKNGYKWDADKKKLEKLIIPKFKEGDVIRKKDGTKECIITKIHGDFYDYVTSKMYKSLYFINRERGYFHIDMQDDYELVPNKFAPQTLQLFDKVLCRMNNDDIWGISLFERYVPTNPYPFFCIQDCFSQCVPYKDNTKHLVGTDKEAPEYYRCWED